ncbi:hypothetical protein JCM3765_002464 [Sporobolomyces pararoseus]
MVMPYEQQAALEAVLGALYHLQSPPGSYGKRFYSLIFRDLPDRQMYPDYYILIKQPRALNDISESLRQGRYSSPQGVAYDLLLIWSNAREYNQQGSQVYADADTLEQYMKHVWQERSPPLPPFDSLPRPGSLPAVPPSLPPTTAPESERKVKRIKLTGASLGSSATKIRIGGPSTSAATPPPAPSTPGITLKLGGRTAASNLANSTPSAALPSLPPLNLPNLPAPPPLASTSSYMGPETNRGERGESTAPTTKKKKRKQSIDPEGDGEGAGESSGLHAITVSDPESGWLGGHIPNPSSLYLDIINRLRNHTDASGRQLAVPLLDLPDRDSRPDYYQLVSDPVALSTIEAKIRMGAYPNPEAFDRDLFHLFETAKVFIRPETPGTVYGDLVVLQRLYQELTKRGTGIDNASNAISSNTGVVPGGIKREDGPFGETSKVTARPTIKDKVLLDSINFKGEVLRVGDWVYLSNSQNPGKPIIAQIWQTYKKADSPQRYLSVCWYYRPEETVHPANRMFYENEVFKTGIFIDHQVEDYISRCFVMFFTKYTRGRPRAPAWTPSIPLYVCEYRYKDDVKQFKKIKSWNSCVPELIRQHEYDFEPYADEHTDTLLKVKSPFVTGVAEGSGGLDNNNFNFTQGGVPATVTEDARSTPTADQTQMDLDVQPLQAPARPLEPVETSTPFAAVAPSTSQGGAVDPSFTNFDTSLLSAPSPAFFAPSTPTTPGLDTTDFFTPLPSALKSKFRNDALGDLLWFGAPAVSPPNVSKPTHSLAYLYWRVQQQQQTRDS